MRNRSDALMFVVALCGATTPVAQTTDPPKGAETAARAPAASAHKTTGTVQSVDPAAGTVMLAHDPLKSLNWPAMTMAFKVKERTLLDKLSKDKKVEIEFVQSGKDYLIINAN